MSVRFQIAMEAFEWELCLCRHPHCTLPKRVWVRAVWTKRIKAFHFLKNICLNFRMHTCKCLRQSTNLKCHVWNYNKALFILAVAEWENLPWGSAVPSSVPEITALVWLSSYCRDRYYVLHFLPVISSISGRRANDLNPCENVNIRGSIELTGAFWSFRRLKSETMIMCCNHYVSTDCFCFPPSLEALEVGSHPWLACLLTAVSSAEILGSRDKNKSFCSPFKITWPAPFSLQT